MNPSFILSLLHTGRDRPKNIRAFEEAELDETVLSNVRKAHYAKPTPVQKYGMPIISCGRDLMACAQTGSGKTVSSGGICYHVTLIALGEASN